MISQSYELINIEFFIDEEGKVNLQLIFFYYIYKDQYKIIIKLDENFIPHYKYYKYSTLHEQTDRQLISPVWSHQQKIQQEDLILYLNEHIQYILYNLFDYIDNPHQRQSIFSKCIDSLNSILSFIDFEKYKQLFEVNAHFPIQFWQVLSFRSQEIIFKKFIILSMIPFTKRLITCNCHLFIHPNYFTISLLNFISIDNDILYSDIKRICHQLLKTSEKPKKIVINDNKFYIIHIQLGNNDIKLNLFIIFKTIPSSVPIDFDTSLYIYYDFHLSKFFYLIFYNLEKIFLKLIEIFSFIFHNDRTIAEQIAISFCGKIYKNIFQPNSDLKSFISHFECREKFKFIQIGDIQTYHRFLPSHTVAA
jgi:hypothetical protein